MDRNQRLEEELFPFYALDALTADERAEVERYVAANPQARSRLEELVEAATEFSAETAPIEPAPTVKAGLMARIAADQPPAESQPASQPHPSRTAAPTLTSRQTAPSRRWWEMWVPLAGALALAGLLFAGVYVVRLSRQVDDLTRQVALLQQGSGDLQSQIDTLEGENANLRRELSAREDQLALYLQPGAVTTVISDLTGEHPTAHGTLTLNRTAGTSTLRVANLPPPDAGTIYQAWLIVGDTPVSAGTFAVDEQGDAVHALTGDLPESFDAVGVSIEPEGGSQTPTPGNIILLGSTS